jgi:hypothetical protein
MAVFTALTWYSSASSDGCPAMVIGFEIFRMDEIPMASFAAPVHKSSSFEFGYKLSHFWRH